jgi:hypothetical protein
MKTKLMHWICQLNSQTNLFKDKTGAKILSHFTSPKVAPIHSPLYRYYLDSHSLKVPDLLHHYLFHRFLLISQIEHQSFYQQITLPACVKDSYIKNVITSLSCLFQNSSFPVQLADQTSELPFAQDRKNLYQDFISKNPVQLFDSLQNYFAKAGKGFISNYYYFEFQKSLLGIPSFRKINLQDLSGYDSQKKLLVENTRKFLDNQEVNHVFLYGSRGTGKTSLISALLNTYQNHGLRLIKITKSALPHLLHLASLLEKRREKFIINLDDISYDENESSYKEHKVILDSFFSREHRNIVLYATSNSQEIVKFFRQETTDTIILDNRIGEEKKLELPERQIYDERRAFTERFGLTIYFGKPDEQVITEILALYRHKYHISTPLAELHAQFAQWILYHGSPNGRTIENFIRESHH